MTLSDKPIVLIDGSSYLYRAFHALPSLANTKGEPTGAVYGVINMIKKLLTDYDPDYMAVVFDPKGKTHRDEIYTEYKANRQAMPSDLAMQIGHIYEIIEALGLPIVVYDGIEADDVIGTLATEATRLGLKTIISTGDKDMAQLVNPSVSLINTMSNTTYDREAVIAKFGVPPEKIIDYLALTGDKVDNIPGVPNVGPKTAVKWLEEYGSLEQVMSHAENIKGKVGENLKTALPLLPLSKQLVTIYTDLKLPDTINDLARSEPDSASLIGLYTELEFKAWLSELLQKQTPDIVKQYDIAVTEEEALPWLNRLQASEMFGLHLQTTRRDPMSAEIVGIAVALAPQEAVYFPLNHMTSETQLNSQWLYDQLRKIFSDEKKILIGDNLKMVLNFFKRCGVSIHNKLYDTMLESYLQNSSTTRHDISTLSLKFLGERTLSYEDVAGKGAKQVAPQALDIKTMAQYAAQNADIALRVHQVMWQSIAADSDALNILETIEMPLMTVLANMEYRGVLIEANTLRQHSVELAKRLQQLEQQAHDMAGCNFNLGSPKQLQVVLYETLGLPITSKTPTGQPSTSEAALQELALDYPLPGIILEHRSLSKVKSTYTDSLPQQINPVTHHVHTCYNQAVTATGRLSSTEPNLQNIPIRHDEGRRIRQAFVATPGCKIVSADYSQIELRLMAHLSQDPGLLKAFELNQDIHVATAAEVFNTPLEQVTQQQRRSAKAINFGLIYGMSSFGLSKQLGIDRNLAQAYIDRYFERYPNILEYMETVRQFAHAHGYVETLHKRRIYLSDINATNLQRQKAAERAAINAPLQGTAAEIIKIAMVNIDRWLQESGMATSMIMQVHDELVFEVPDSELEEAVKKIEYYMTHCVELNVPLLVGIGVGNNWDVAH